MIIWIFKLLISDQARPSYLHIIFRSPQITCTVWTSLPKEAASIAFWNSNAYVGVVIGVCGILSPNPIMFGLVTYSNQWVNRFKIFTDGYFTWGEFASPPDEELTESLATGTLWSSASKVRPSNITPAADGGTLRTRWPTGSRSKSAGSNEGWAWIWLFSSPKASWKQNIILKYG